MPSKLSLLILSCLLLSAIAGFAQQIPEGFSVILPKDIDLVQTMRSPMVQQVRQMAWKNPSYSSWKGPGIFFSVSTFIQDPDCRIAWGVTDVQNQQITDRLSKSLPQDPEYKKIIEETRAIVTKNKNEPHRQNINEESLNQIFKIKRVLKVSSAKHGSDAHGNFLTAEQKQKMNESILVAMGEMGHISVRTFEALNLTDTQKQQMEQIQKEFEIEFAKTLELFANVQIIWTNNVLNELAKQGKINDVKEYNERFQTVSKRLQTEELQKENSEYNKSWDEYQTVNTTFQTKYTTKMFDVLIDAQWTRLQKLIDNPPEHAKVFLEWKRKQNGTTEKFRVPIPESYRQERNTRSRFPRSEQ